MRVLAVLVCVLSMASPAWPCASLSTLEERLLRALMRFTPNAPLADLDRAPDIDLTETSRIGDGSGRQAWYTILVRDDRGSVGTLVWCRVSDDDRLLECEPGVVSRTRYASLAKAESLRLGDTVGTVLSELCPSPNVDSRSDGTFVLHYLIPVRKVEPGDRDALHLELTFDRKGKLIKKNVYGK